MPQKRSVSTFLKNNWLLSLAILYVLLPIDIIPDILPVIGGVDDSLLLVIELLRKYGEYKKTGGAKD